MRATGRTLTTRRTVLAGAGGAITTSLAGCTSGSGSLDSIQVAYMPIYPDMQYFVMQEEGYFDELSVDVDGKRFSDGPSIVQASAKGNMDVMMFGIVPAMIVMDKGIPAKITAANIKNAMKILASDEFATLWDQYGSDAFEQFEAQKGRKFTFGTFPPGSVPDILLRYWIDEKLGLDPENDVNITGLAGAGPVRQALLSGKVDGTSIMEPVPTIISEKGANYQSIAWAGDFMPGQPAAVTLMHNRLREDNTDVASEFVRQHRRATQFSNDNSAKAAQDASTVIGESALPVETARKAMDSRASAFITNPHDIEDKAVTFSEYASDLGKTEQTFAKSDLFDFSIYDQL